MHGLYLDGELEKGRHMAGYIMIPNQVVYIRGQIRQINSPLLQPEPLMHGLRFSGTTIWVVTKVFYNAALKNFPAIYMRQ